MGSRAAGLGRNWTSFDNTPHAFWAIFPAGANVPVRTVSYSMTNYGDAGEDVYGCRVAWGPFNIQNLPGARLEFDMWSNMVDDFMQFDVYAYQGSALPATREVMSRNYSSWAFDKSKQWKHVVDRSTTS